MKQNWLTRPALNKMRKQLFEWLCAVCVEFALAVFGELRFAGVLFNAACTPEARLLDLVYAPHKVI